jgi:hypothetical protein
VQNALFNFEAEGIWGTARIISGGRGEVKNFAYKLAFKPFNAPFTDLHIVFRREE